MHLHLPEIPKQWERIMDLLLPPRRSEVINHIQSTYTKHNGEFPQEETEDHIFLQMAALLFASNYLQEENKNE